MNETGKQNFIRVVEVWTPDTSGKALELGDGLYGPLSDFGKYSSGKTFTHGEGLPGKAWKDAMPVVLTEFDDATFMRTEAAHAAGLTSGVAIPLFSGEQLNAVLVFLCGDKDDATGAIEVWCDDDLSGLALVDGYYGDLERFEWLSKSIRFPRGTGLPGGVWKSGQAQVIGDLANSSSFLRASSAIASGITTGIGIPFYSAANEEDISAVVTFLSSNRTPIARRFEVWRADPDSDNLVFESGIEQAQNIVEAADPQRHVGRGEGVIGQVWHTGIPKVAAASATSGLGQGAEEYESLLAIPIMHQGSTHSVVVFYN